MEMEEEWMRSGIDGREVGGEEGSETVFHMQNKWEKLVKSINKFQLGRGDGLCSNWASGC